MNGLYRDSLALLTDLYQLTMAYGYWKNQMSDHEAIFHLIFRKAPFKGSWAVMSGTEAVAQYLSRYRFQEEDLNYLSTLTAPSGAPLFEEAFLKYLQNLEFSCDIDIVREGEIVFPNEPLVRVQGPLIQCQLLETVLLTLINFPTLIATKAARLVKVARGDAILEFGLRRAQGIDGGITASRAAFVAGIDATSNVLAGKLFGIPVRGTHAHSWVMAFDSELEAFYAYAHALGDNAIFLVDTYDTLQGVRNAIEVGKWLRQQGKPFLGIRLDSGNLEWLAKRARQLLDEAGFSNSIIYASNQLDEHAIEQLKEANCPIAVWGVGTHLVTAHSQPALDGVYKLSAICAPHESWKYRLKISEDLTKGSDPGALAVKRFYKEGYPIGDVIYDQMMQSPQDEVFIAVDMRGEDIHPPFSISFSEDLLKPLFRHGKLVADLPQLDDIQKFSKKQQKLFGEANYFVGLEKQLYLLKQQLIQRYAYKSTVDS